MRKVPRAVLFALASFTASGALLSARPIAAQPAQPQPAKPAKPEDELGPGEQAVKAKPDRLGTELAAQPGGLTFATVAREAVLTSTAVKSREADIDDAAGQKTQTMVNFFPVLTLSASYTRLSPVDEPSLGGGGSILGAANAGPVSVGPCPDNPAAQCVLDAGGLPVAAQPFDFSFPQFLNQYAFNANLTVPISDYFLRSVQAYNAAEHNEKSLEAQAEAERLSAGADAKLALLNWIGARGARVVAELGIEQSKAQLADAKATFEVGNASQADVFRIEAQLAQSEFNESEARALENVAEHRLRVLMHAKPSRQFAIGVDIFKDPGAPKVGNIEELVSEAVQARLELKATSELRMASEEIESTTNAGYWPRLDAFADATLANPNQRIIPSRDKFDFTWDVGLRLTWTVNETFATLGASKSARARTARIDAQQEALVDAIRLEVVQAHADLMKAQPNVAAAARGLQAAEETLRVTEKLFAFGKATGTALADAQTALQSARLRKLVAHVNQYGALIRLEHAVGRDRGQAPLARNSR
ncbi:MAG: TolC family protein [Polyangiaceae bacterium]|nr:TolC family protein [Polyangiaceae bacterium]